MTVFDLESTYLALDGKGGVVQMPVAADFWETIGSSPAAHGTLVGIYRGDKDWPHWETHPAGDEVLVLIDGALTMILKNKMQEEHVPMKPGDTLIVNAGIAHRALARGPYRLLALTYGRGTEHSPL